MRKSIQEFPKYEIDTEGNVWSNRPLGGQTRMKNKPSLLWRKLKVRKAKGQLRVGFRIDGKTYYRIVSRLMGIAFLPNPENKPFVCHNDNDWTNNVISNLRWGTAQENQDDRIAHGTKCYGERNGLSLLTAKEVKEIKFLIKDNISYSEIAKLYSVKVGAIGCIARGETWTHV